MKKKTLIATSLTLAAGVLLLLLVQDSRRGNDDVDNLPSESGIPGESSEDVGAGKKPPQFRLPKPPQFRLPNRRRPLIPQCRKKPLLYLQAIF